MLQMWLIQTPDYLNVHSTCNYWSIQSDASFIQKSQPHEGEYKYNDVLHGQKTNPNAMYICPLPLHMKR